MIVVLIGYMASGKSTLGRILADKLSYTFIDLDDFIEENEKKPIKEIFKSRGEIYFRATETDSLKGILSKKDNIILSLGGGTPCYSNNMDTILNFENVTSIYLKASIPTIIDRLKGEKGKRPLIAHIETDDLLAEFIGKHLFERSQFYNKAQITVSTDNKTQKDIIEELIVKLF